MPWCYTTCVDHCYQERARECSGPGICRLHSGASSRVRGDEETLHSSWNIYKKGIRENEREVVGEIWPADFCEKKRSTDKGCSCHKLAEKGPSGRLRVSHMKQGASNWLKWTIQLKCVTWRQQNCYEQPLIYCCIFRSVFLWIYFFRLWERISLEGFEQLTWNFQCQLLLKFFLGWA